VADAATAEAEGGQPFIVDVGDHFIISELVIERDPPLESLIKG
jgi:hypothetical protein